MSTNLGDGKKGLPRGNFSKSSAIVLPVQAGQSGNPGGRPEPGQTITEIYESILRAPAPIELCRALGLPARSSIATVIAMALVHRAVYKTSAGKLLIRLTEGPLPTRKRETGQIPRRLTARELLIKRWGEIALVTPNINAE